MSPKRRLWTSWLRCLRAMYRRRPGAHRLSGMVHRRDPFPLAQALESFTRDVQPASVLAEVQRGWADAVGETIAGWTTPVAEKSGIVVVECDDSVVAHELEMMKSEI